MQVIEEEGGRFQFAVMDSIYEMFSYVAEPDGKNCRDPQNAKVAQRAYQWATERYGGEDVQTTIKKYLEPNGEFAEEIAYVKRYIENALDDLGVKRDRPLRKIRRRLEAGDELDTQAYIQRQSDGWSEVQKRRQPHRAIKIAVNVSMSTGMVNAGRAVSRGAAFAAMSDVLEDIGYTTEIGLFDVTLHAGTICKTYVVEVPVKKFGSPLDVSQIAFMGSNTSFIGNVVFPMQARVLRGKSNHWGHPGPVPANIAGNYDIMIDNVFTMNQSIQLIKKYADMLKE